MCRVPALQMLDGSGGTEERIERELPFSSAKRLRRYHRDHLHHRQNPNVTCITIIIAVNEMKPWHLDFISYYKLSIVTLCVAHKKKSDVIGRISFYDEIFLKSNCSL